MDIETFATVIGVLTVVIGLFVSISEYERQGKQKRAEYFLDMRRRFKENEDFAAICDLLENDPAEPELVNLDRQVKYNFLGFFEEIIIMMNSGLIPREIVHYMFGYYARICWQSETFWNDHDPDDVNAPYRYHPYWSLFREFAEQAEQMKDVYPTTGKPQDCRF